MTWFKVDDAFHSHPKVLASQPAALGLWVVAGSWCSANPSTNGFVPDYVLPRLLPDSAELAKQLVAVGLWRRTKGGHRFHDWEDYQPTGEEATAAKNKKSSGGKLGNHRRWHAARGVIDPNCPYCGTGPADRSDEGSDGGSDREAMREPIDNRSSRKPSPSRSGQDSPGANSQANRHFVSDNRSHSDRYTDSDTDSVPHPPTRPDPPPRDGGSVSDTGTGSQSVRTHAHAREIHRYLNSRYGGLTDQMSAAVFRECERRSPDPIKHPVKYLEGMELGDLADIVQAVMDAEEEHDRPHLELVPDPPEQAPAPPAPLPEPPPELTPEERQRLAEEREQLLAPFRQKLREQRERPAQ